MEKKNEPTLRVVPMPSDSNSNGDIFGGWIMSQVDIAGAIPVVQLVNGRVATVAVNSFVFKQPVFIGDLVSFYATIKKIGTTSVTVNVEVFAPLEQLPRDCDALTSIIGQSTVALADKVVGVNPVKLLEVSEEVTLQVIALPFATL